jgi:hypothetical protein
MSFGMYTSIQQAVLALNGGPGEVCILPGNYYENVLLQGLEGVVIHGCEWQTYVYSKALQSSSSGSSPSSPSGSSPAQSGLAAVFTVIGCQNLEFNSFSISAADEEVGILIDRPAAQSQGEAAYENQDAGNTYFSPFAFISKNIIIEEMQISASTLPCLVARGVEQLKVEDNQFSMEDVRSIYPAVYLSGREMFFVRNQVGLSEPFLYHIQDNAEERTREINVGSSGFRTLAAGGIQIGGPSQGVFVLENSITDGSRNGITLGDIIFLDANGGDTYKYVALLPQAEDMCGQGGNGGLPTGGSGGSPGAPSNPIGSGGLIRDLYIERNQIQNFGMSGIGPVGYFDLYQRAEVVSLVNVNITANTITSTLLRNVIQAARGASTFGYGAIGIPDHPGQHYY